jgi:hypothetical protein
LLDEIFSFVLDAVYEGVRVREGEGVRVRVRVKMRVKAKVRVNVRGTLQDATSSLQDASRNRPISSHAVLSYWSSVSRTLT